LEGQLSQQGTGQWTRALELEILDNFLAKFAKALALKMEILDLK
jgi:hypothetical protein